MRPLTAPLVRDFPYSGLADPGVLKRGRDYYRDQRVVALELISDSVASCLVEGDSDDYEVEIKSTSGKYGLSFSCNCPYADDGSFCKHMYAAALELSALLEDGADKIQFNPRIPAMPDRTRGK